MDISNSTLWGTSVTSFQQAREWRHVNGALWEFQRGFCRRVTGGSERANGWWLPNKSLHTPTGLVQCTPNPLPQNPSALRARRESIWLTELSGRAPLPCHQGPGEGGGRRGGSKKTARRLGVGGRGGVHRISSSLQN